LQTDDSTLVVAVGTKQWSKNNHTSQATNADYMLAGELAAIYILTRNQEWNWSSDGRRNGSINSRNDLAPLSLSNAGHWLAGCNIILVLVC
jgi:hypothetical protein